MRPILLSAVLGLAILQAPTDPDPGSLVAIPPMEAPRAAHTASRLPNGEALIAGGMGSPTEPISGAVLFNPTTGRFRSTGAMGTRRYSHSATVLPDGRVLLVGGFGPGNVYLSSAELYDPATGRFTPTGQMTTARSDQAAVLLEDGRVLIVGGVGTGWTFLSSAEIYDPRTGRFTATGGMSVPRESHVLVRLADGRVLVAGGHSGRRADVVIYASAEVYDPAAGVFTRSGDMVVPRHKHDAVLLSDGRVLINGGADRRDNLGTFRSTEFFDPATGRFSMGPEMQLARYKHRGTSLLLPDGRYLIGGGAPQAEVFDPVRLAFTLVPGDGRMAGQFSAAALLPDGGALMTGGYGGEQGAGYKAWRYHP